MRPQSKACFIPIHVTGKLATAVLIGSHRHYQQMSRVQTERKVAQLGACLPKSEPCRLSVLPNVSVAASGLGPEVHMC